MPARLAHTAASRRLRSSARSSSSVAAGSWVVSVDLRDLTGKPGMPQRPCRRRTHLPVVIAGHRHAEHQTKPSAHQTPAWSGRRSQGRGFWGRILLKEHLIDLPGDRQFSLQLANPALRGSELHLPPRCSTPAPHRGQCAPASASHRSRPAPERLGELRDPRPERARSTTCLRTSAGYLLGIVSS
jgi:hypothetical protein